ncbi:Na+/H+ antiporter NhaA [Massilia sp.]|uniref:Na+/H+ antiporter NhaA n=1 Tax=Massilia sp. TaxID=1882437 RepID=UPI002899C383|nr:Na+/H+ antiporter NhaA [Massilia sp.]
MHVERRLSRTFQDFLHSGQAGGVLLILCTLVSLALANSALGDGYLGFWRTVVGGLSVELWVNDALMAVFFLLVGLELKRELVSGELSSLRNALLPVIAAFGGVAVPALIHFGFNGGTPTQAGIGIPMATDIAFALGVLTLLGKGVPASLKVFVAALAVIDDLIAIVVIALFYTSQLSVVFLAAALALFAVLLVLNRVAGVKLLSLYLIGGALMWFCMLKSGVHATIAGVLLAFAIPHSTREDDAASPSERLEHTLHTPVAFLILPIFALANTGVVIGADWANQLASSNSLGIIFGLVAGKPVGIVLACFAAVAVGVCRLPLDLAWRHILGAGMLGGIGFTMSIFITNLAFEGRHELVDASKLAILTASLTAGVLGFVWLKLRGGPTAADTDPQTMDFEVQAGAK